jgi:sugar transferase (PEP-CTERM/EpsH1 system associated)
MKILFLTSRFPYPTFTGDRLRAYIQIRSLARDHEVTLVCPNEGARPEHVAHMQTLCADVRAVDVSGGIGRWIRTAVALLRGDRPLQIAYFHSRRMADAVSECLAARKFDAVHVHLVRCAEYVRGLEGPAKVIDMCDSLALEYERRATYQRTWMRPLHRIESRRLLDYERRLAREFDRVIMISPTDAQSLSGFDNVDVLVNSVDASERESRERLPNSIMFTGYIGFYSDEIAVTYFHDRVLPLIIEQVPDAHFYIVGAEPSKRVRAMAGPHVTVTGFVDSVADYLAKADVSVSPMRVGAGLKNKILEAMIHRVPVVTTSLGNQGIGAVPNESILVGDTPRAFADHVVALLRDREYRDRIGDAGRDFVAESFSFDVVSRRLAGIYASMMEARRADLQDREGVEGAGRMRG